MSSEEPKNERKKFTYERVSLNEMVDLIDAEKKKAIRKKLFGRSGGSRLNPNKCRIGPGTPDKINGYGRLNITFKGKKRLCSSHRLAYTLVYGKIRKGRVVMHTCDNRMCVNPAHLRLGTDRDNAHDKIKKGRAAKPGNSLSKMLPKPIVDAIRKMRDEGATIWYLSEILKRDTKTIAKVLKKGYTKDAEKMNLAALEKLPCKTTQVDQNSLFS